MKLIKPLTNYILFSVCAMSNFVCSILNVLTFQVHHHPLIKEVEEDCLIYEAKVFFFFPSKFHSNHLYSMCFWMTLMIVVGAVVVLIFNLPCVLSLTCIPMFIESGQRSGWFSCRVGVFQGSVGSSFND